MNKSIKNLESLDEFGVEEISLKMMEEINGGDDIWFDLGYSFGKGLYYVGKYLFPKPTSDMGIPVSP